MKKIAIIIVTFNSQKQITACLASIEKNFSRNFAVKIILIDNNSSDKTLEFIEKNKKLKFTLIKNNQNKGFAGGVNQGLVYNQKNIDAELVLLLNPDATLSPNCLEKMLKIFLMNEKIGLVSPKIINPKNNQIWFCGGKINWLKMKTSHISSCQNLSFKNNYYLSGCCLMIRKKILEKIGLFDEDFFLYYEDADYSLQTKKGGFDLALAENAVCFHEESQSTDSRTKNYHLTKSGMIFFKKYYPQTLLPYFYFVLFLRIFYHRFFSGKKEVHLGLVDFFWKK